MLRTFCIGLPSSGGRPCSRDLRAHHVRTLSDGFPVRRNVLRSSLEFGRHKAQVEAGNFETQTVDWSHRNPAKDINPDPLNHSRKRVRGSDGLVLGDTDGKTSLSLSGEANHHRKRAVKQKEVLDIVRLQKVKDFELDALALDIDNVEGMVAVREERIQKDTLGPGVVRHKRTFGGFANIELNSKVRGDFLQGSQRIHTVLYYLHA